MRRLSTLTIVALALCGAACAHSQGTCAAGSSASVSGTVYAPNGTDPLPNVTVYIPLSTAPAPLPAFPQGVACSTVGTPPAEASTVGTTTAVDGTFTLTNVPVGNGIPIVAVSGKWRVQGTVNTTACGSSTISLNMPQNHTQGDIPWIAIATGSADQAECVLLKMGISQAEFTDPGGGGRINLFGGGGARGTGVTLDAATPTQASLMGNASTLDNYDVLMLPCEGGDYAKPVPELANLIAFANGGGRVYSSHFSYSWMYQNPPFDGVVNWAVNDPGPSGSTATVNTGFTAGQTLATWLQNVGASTSPGQMTLDTLRQNFNGVIPPTQSWLTLNDPPDDPVMQFVFDTPIPTTPNPTTANPTPNQCGRVLYNEYHVENGSVKAGTIFPNECDLTAAMTPQEKLLEYMLFELTSEGGQPTLAPTAQDFGPEAVNSASAAQSFTWTNNSSFTLPVSSATIGGTNAADFAIASPPCGSVVGGASCTITVVFTPSVLGAETATLTVASSGTPLTATLTGTGVPGFTASASTLSFGNVVVSESAPQLLTLTSNATDPQPVPASFTTGHYSVNTAGCANPVPARGTCVASVVFSPTALGVQTGTLTVNSSGSPLTVALTGTGVPGFSLTPASLSFGNQDVGFSSAAQTLTLTSVGTGPLAVPVFTTTGPYSVSAAACGSTLAAGATCPVTVIFTPPVTGPLSGTVGVGSANPVYSGLSAALSGNGVDFTIILNPAAGTVVAGDGTTTTATLTPLAGFAAQLTVSCTATGIAASSCTPSPATVVPSAAVTSAVGITTTSQYVVVGYGGFGGGCLWLVGAASGWLLWRKRRSGRALLRGGLLAVLLGAMGLSLSGCTGKLPSQNAAWTGAGNYSVTVTATDGLLVHSATYSLTVTAQ